MGARGVQKDEARHAAILAAYEELGTLQKAGDRLGITRERVRQVVTLAKGGGIWERKRVAVLAVLDEALPLAIGLDDLAKRVGVSTGALRSILRQQGTYEGIQFAFDAARVIRRQEARPHGTSLKYRADHCRCAPCRRANADDHVIQTRKRLGQDPFAPLHNTAGVDAGHIPVEAVRIRLRQTFPKE